MRMTPRERFEDSCLPEPNSGCWLWEKTISKNGYGRIRFNGRKDQAHRVSYELHIGPIPEGMWVLHKCDIRCCVNPDHLFLGTRQDNMDDMKKKGRQYVPTGTINGRAKLTENDVLKIREDNRNQYLVAADYGISQTAVSCIKLLKTWSHL